jgi:AcrR family transcriptional regulator
MATERSQQEVSTAASDARRDQILRAALDVIAERGFSDTRIADVANRSDVSSGLVIYYFKTKDQLLTEAMRFAEDAWYEEGARRMAAIASAAGRLEAIVGMTFDGGPTAVSLNGSPADEPRESWALWLDLWALSVRNPAVAEVRREFDEHWRRTIRNVVSDGIRDGEFDELDVESFGLTFSALLDGLAVQVALRDPSVNDDTAFATAMQFASDRLGFAWPGARRSRSKGQRGKGHH